MKFSANKKGFTLVEMLMVIAIIGMLSTLAVTGYMGYRKSTVLDLAVDNFISQLNQMRSNTIYGKADSMRFDDIQAAVDGGTGEIAFAENLSKCFGIYFEQQGEYFVANSFQQDFVGKKVWDGQAWGYQGCPVPDAGVLEPLSLDDQIVVKEISEGGDGFYVRATPPDGKLQTGPEVENFTVVLGYPDELEEKYQRTILIDVVAGRFTKVINETVEIQ